MMGERAKAKKSLLLARTKFEETLQSRHQMLSIRDATSIKDIHISLGQISNDLAELEVDLANVAKARRTFSNIHQA